MDIPYTVETRPDTGLYNAKVGIWLFLASEVMLFGALFSSYILLRVGAPEGYKLISLLSIGHPAEQPHKDKRPLSDVLHWERF